MLQIARRLERLKSNLLPVTWQDLNISDCIRKALHSQSLDFNLKHSISHLDSCSYGDARKFTHLEAKSAKVAFTDGNPRPNKFAAHNLLPSKRRGQSSKQTNSYRNLNRYCILALHKAWIKPLHFLFFWAFKSYSFIYIYIYFACCISPVA